MESKVKSAKASKSSRDLQELSLSIGDFIRYWGFRRIHGAVWTQLYLSKTPLSCTDLVKKLGLSKALISPALDELCQYNLINEAPSPNEKTKVYVAAENVNDVIRQILKERERRILKKITQDYANFKKNLKESEDVNPERVESLGDMIVSANLMLEIMLSQDDLMGLPQEIEK